MSRLPPSSRYPVLLAAVAAGCLGLSVEVRAQEAGGDGGAGDPDVTLQYAREEMASGRYWHAAELILDLQRSGGLTEEGLLLLARARAGYRNWEGVLEILEDAPWAETLAPGEVALLVGRAHESAGRWASAAASYRAAVARTPDPGFPLLARLARAELRAGERDAAVAGLRRMEGPGMAPLLGALAWELAAWGAAEGDSATVGRLLPMVGNAALLQRAAGFYPRAVLAQGDSARAETLYRELLRDADGGLAASWRERVAALTLARGDTTAARELYRETLLAAGRTAAGGAAAAALVRLGGLDREEALAAARALDRQGNGSRALEAYDAYVRSAREAGVEPDAAARVERARLASTVPRRVAEAVEEFRALDEHPDPAVGARALDVWAGLRQRQGRADNVRTLREWLVERYPDTDQAASAVFLQGDDAQDRGDWAEAAAHYRRVAEMAPARSLAGAARMRVGQILLHTGDREGALATYRAYLDDFPEGRRWAEAGFWAGWILAEAGDTASAAPLLERILEEDPFSYYALEAATILGRSYPGELAEGPALAESPWVASGLERLDLMEEAGLEEALGIHVEALVTRAGGDGPEAMYPLAEGLILRGRTIEGINLGWAMVREGEGWNARLLRILYPFPSREMVEREALEWGLDPLLMAGLIRQESAWDRDIVSSAGAVGLMQVMPPTGRQLARAIGPAGFSTESLETPEVNLHLGGRFLRDMLDRFGPELPLVLSAYNAGPSRAQRWRTFPEAPDRLRFTERIPFTETRGYVKNVTRNLALYRALYAAPAGAPAAQ